MDLSFYGLVRGLYGTVAYVYDMMISLTDNFSKYDFGSFTESIYVIAGVFMLFRTLLGLINMLINPEQVSDSNAGAGKMITRIIVCILLLLLFNPDGIILNKKDGLLTEVQDAIIGEDGFLERFAPEASMSGDGETEETKISGSLSFLYETVEAKSPKTCYFMKKSDKNNISNTFYKITFYDTQVSGSVKVGKDTNSLYAKAQTGTEKDFTFSSIALATRTGVGQKLNENSYVGNCESWELDNNKFSHKSESWYDEKSYHGYNSVADMQIALEADIKANRDLYKEICLENSGQCPSKVKQLVNSVSDWMPGVSMEGIGFSENVLSSFLTCQKNIDECEQAKELQFGGVDSDGNFVSSDDGKKQITNMIGDEIEFDFMMSLIAAFALIVFILILCVDVVIRQLKLMVLEMIAPIPIISYVDPKDKIFNNWLKMFISVYADLFIKLFAIKVVLVLIAQLDNLDVQGLEYFFVIIGILMFAKLLPSMISKIFGIEMGSSFKDIGNMLKTGAGFAVGGVLVGGTKLGYAVKNVASTWKDSAYDKNGNAVNIGKRLAKTTGTGIAGVAGTVGAIAYGASAGAKGKTFDATKSIAAQDEKLQQQKADGLNFWDRSLVSLSTATGIPLGGKKIQQYLTLLGEGYKENSSAKDYVTDEMKKKGQMIGNNKGFDPNGEAHRILTEHMKDKDGESLVTNENGVFKVSRDIMSKDGRTVAITKTEAEALLNGTAEIDIKDEYNKLDKFSSVDEWISSQGTRRVGTGEFEVKMTSIDKNGQPIYEKVEIMQEIPNATAQDYQNELKKQQNRVVVLEDIARSIRVSEKLKAGDDEMVKFINAEKDKLTELFTLGKAVGLDEDLLNRLDPTRLDADKITSDTFGDIKNAIIRAENIIKKEQEKEIVRQGYIDKKS